MSQDTTPGGLNGLPLPKQKIIKFDPTVSSGTILQLGSMLLVAAGAWATYQSDKATSKLEIDQLKAGVAADKATNKEALAELKGDVRELQRTVNQTNQMIAVLNAHSKERP